jgi:hypothetical protein
MDAVIHNAGISSTNGRSPTPEGHASILAVNTLAPYILTALIERPRRLVYLSSSMHRDGSRSLRDISWSERPWNSNQANSDSKLQAAAVSGRYWHHRRPQAPARETEDPVFQDEVSARLAELTGVSLF